MNAIFSMIGCLFFGGVLGVFFELFSEGTELFGGISQIGWVIACVSLVTILFFGLKNNNYMFIQVAAISVLVTPICLSIINEMNKGVDASAFGISIEKIAPWALIVHLTLLAAVVMLEAFGFVESRRAE